MKNLEETDLRGITRNPDKVVCRINVGPASTQTLPWIICGEVNIQNEEQFCRIHARMDCTDFEHDSAYAFSLPVIGLKFKFVTNHTSIFEAWVNPQSGEPYADFHVPRPGYDPRKLEGTEKCTDERCGETHLIIPEGYYQPPFDAELFKLVRGVRLDIQIGPDWRKLTPEAFE